MNKTSENLGLSKAIITKVMKQIWSEPGNCIHTGDKERICKTSQAD